MPIRDLGYQPYAGPRLPHGRRFWVVTRCMLGRAWASKMTRLILLGSLFPMVVCGVVMYLQLKAQSLVGNSTHIRINLDEPNKLVFICFFYCQIWFALALSLRLGAPAIAEDLRTGAFQFYFARPLGQTQYLLGKTLPVALLVLVVSAGPALMLSLMRLVLCRDAQEVLRVLPLLLATLAYAPIFTAVLTLPAMALSSLGRRPGLVQALWAAVFFFSWILGSGLASAIDEPRAVILSLPTNLMLLGQHLYRMDLAHPVPWFHSAGVLTVVLVGSVALLQRRLRHVEVFS